MDELGCELGERREGRLEFRGPSATSGYFRNEAKTRELFHDGWLDSGDRAYMAGGDVYITGRIKDIIIRAGQHIYPQEIEEAVAEIPGIRKGCVAVFGVADRASGTERVVVLAETRESDPPRARALAGACSRGRGRHRRYAAGRDRPRPATHGAEDVERQDPPQRCQGALRNRARREAAAGAAVADPAPLAGGHVGAQVFRLMVAARETLYAAWWWIVIPLGYVTAWLAVLLLPRLAWRWRAVRGIARATLAAAGVPVRHRRAWIACPAERRTRVQSFELHGCGGSCRGSARRACPTSPSASSLRSSLSGISCAASARLSSSVSIPARALPIRKAPSLLPGGGATSSSFPRARSRAARGFPNSISAPSRWRRAGLPAVPGIIRGTRSMLRSDQWFPRWTPLSVTIGSPIMPSGKDFAAMLQLRDEARKVVLAGCGEPDLGELVETAPSPTRHVCEL